MTVCKPQEPGLAGHTRTVERQRERLELMLSGPMRVSGVNKHRDSVLLLDLRRGCYWELCSGIAAKERQSCAYLQRLTARRAGDYLQRSSSYEVLESP